MVENPNTWTDLHNAICRALYATAQPELVLDAVWDVLDDEPQGTHLTREDLAKLQEDHENSMQQGICGFSLVAKIYNAHMRANHDER